MSRSRCELHFSRWGRAAIRPLALDPGGFPPTGGLGVIRVTPVEMIFAAPCFATSVIADYVDPPAWDRIAERHHMLSSGEKLLVDLAADLAGLSWGGTRLARMADRLDDEHWRIAAGAIGEWARLVGRTA